MYRVISSSITNRRYNHIGKMKTTTHTIMRPCNQITNIEHRINKSKEQKQDLPNANNVIC